MLRCGVTWCTIVGMRLTEHVIRELGRPAKTRTISDDGRLGLRLVVRPSGAMSWTQRLTQDGKRRDIGLGRWPAVSLTEARRKAKANHTAAERTRTPPGNVGSDILTQLLETNRAMLAELSALRAEVSAMRPAAVVPAAVPAIAGRTFEAVALESLERDAAGFKAGSGRAAKLRAMLAEHVTPKLGCLDIGTVTPQHVIDSLEPIWMDRPAVADVALQRISKTFDYAVAVGLRPDNPALPKTIKTALPKRAKANTTKHHEAIPHGDLAEALSKVDASGATPTVKALSRFLALTAVRTGEARMADWAEFDMRAKLWTIPADRMKAGRSHQVPLSDAAVAILKGLGPKRQGLVFGNGKPASERTVSSLFGRLGIGTPHGLRSSFRDWAGETGVDRTVAEHCLAHRVGNSTEQAYARSTMLDRRREVMDAWAEYLAS